MHKEISERNLDLVESSLKYSHHVSCLSTCTIKLPLKSVSITLFESVVQDMEKDEKMTPETKLFIKEGQTLLAYWAINSIFQDIFHLENWQKDHDLMCQMRTLLWLNGLCVPSYNAHEFYCAYNMDRYLRVKRKSHNNVIFSQPGNPMWRTEIPLHPLGVSTILLFLFSCVLMILSM